MENPLVLGGLIAAGLGVAASVSKVGQRAWQGLQRFLCTTVDVADHDDAFYWLQLWLAKHPYSEKARLLTASTRQRGVYPVPGGPVEAPRVTFSPAPGLHIIRWRRRWVLLTRARKEVTTSDMFAYRETFTLRAFTRDRAFVRDLLHEARDIALAPTDAQLVVYSPSRYGEWRVSARRMPRPIESVVFDDDRGAEVLADARRFLDSAAWYREVGVPHRRGYLLYGPPGNGKTSLVAAVASALGYNLAAVGLMSRELTDDALHGLLADLPDRTVVLMEDVDAAFNGRRAVAEQKLTFAGLLNILDGVASAEGRILFMTTNHISDLDPAFIRPGRVDVPVFIGHATPAQARRLYLRFFPDEEALADLFAEGVPDGEVAMASLQNHLLANREDANSAARSWAVAREKAG